MRKSYCIILLLLASLSALGQKRVYLHKDEFRDDIYVTKSEDGDITAFFELEILSRIDSLYLVANKSNVDAIRNYMIELRDTYDQWSIVAKRNKVKKVKKPFTIESPIVRFRWMERKQDNYSRFPVLRMSEHFSTTERWITPDFVVTENGHALVSFDLQLKDDAANSFHARFFLSRSEINRIIRWADYGKLVSAYEGKKPRLTDKEVLDLFD